jgi:MFS family permease
MAYMLFLANGLYSPFITPYLLGHGFDKEQISFITSLAPLALIIFPPIFGKLSDIIGRQKVISITIALMVTAIFFYLGVDHKYGFLVLATILSCIGFGGAYSTIFSQNEDSLKKHRGLYTGTFESLIYIGSLVGTSIGTYIVATSDIENTLKLSIAILLLLFLYNNLRKKHNHVSYDVRSLNPLTAIRNFWAIRDLRGMGIMGMAMNFASAATIIFIPILLLQVLHTNVIYVGYFALACGLGNATQFGFGYACELYGLGRTVMRSTFIYGVLISLLFFANGPLAVIVFGFLGGLAQAAWNTSAVCYMSEIGEKLREEGVVMGSYSSVASIGSFAGFIVSGLLVSLISVNYLFLIYGAVIFAGVAIALPYFRQSKYY